MPSGRTHDALTFLLAAPTGFAVYLLANSWLFAVLVTGGMLFGGLMFGPDLDIHSKQYTRWKCFRFCWLPYQICFRHRSRWSHGIFFGTLIRVIYFTGILALFMLAFIYLHATLTARSFAPDAAHFLSTWRAIAAFADAHGIGLSALLAALAGIWWGAAVHTLADFLWTTLRRGKEIF
jgi:uncharacterized metal-binding protein